MGTFPLIIPLLKLAENTGTLLPALIKITHYLSAKNDHRQEMILSHIQPLFLGLIGGILNGSGGIIIPPIIRNNRDSGAMKFIATLTDTGCLVVSEEAGRIVSEGFYPSVEVFKASDDYRHLQQSPNTPIHIFIDTQEQRFTQETLPKVNPWPDIDF